MKEWHPDKHPNNIDQATKMSALINEAYATIMDYLHDYQYDFDEETLKKKTQSPQEWWEERFNTH